MPTQFNILNAEQFIREYMRQNIKKSNPAMDLSTNSAFDDIFIKPMVSIMQPIFSLVSDIELRSNLKYADYLTDDVIADIGQNNYAVTMSGGSIASGTQTFGFSRFGENGITIPSGVVVTTQDGLVFSTREARIFTASEVKQSFNAQTQTYDLSVPIVAETIGTQYNVGANTISICATSFSDYLVYTTNQSALTGGSNTENRSSYLSRIRTYYADQHIGTRPGYRTLISNLYPNLSDIRIIGYQDEGMERDTVEVVRYDGDGNVKFHDVDDKSYAEIEQKHIGGCVDIYVRGSQYQTDTVQLQCNSNFISLNGAANNIKITEKTAIGGEYALLPDTDYLVRWMKNNDDTDGTDNSVYKTYRIFVQNNYTREYIDYYNVVFDPTTHMADDPAPVYESNYQSGAIPKLYKIDGANYYGLIYTVPLNPVKNSMVLTFSAASDISSFYAQFYFNNTVGPTEKAAIKFQYIKEDGTSVTLAQDEYSIISEDPLTDITGWRLATIMPNTVLPARVRSIKISFDPILADQKNVVLTRFALYNPYSASSSDKLTPQVISKTSFESIAGKNHSMGAIGSNLNLMNSLTIDDVTYPVQWESSNPSVIKTDGTVTRAQTATGVTLKATVLYASDPSKGTASTLMYRTYPLKVLAAGDYMWEASETYNEEAEKTLIQIKKEYEKDVSLDVQYMLQNEEATMTQTYTFSQEEKEIKAPIVDRPISVTFTTDKEWTNRDYRSWQDQLEAAFQITIDDLPSEATDDEVFDLKNTLAIKRFRLNTSHELLTGSAYDPYPSVDGDEYTDSIVHSLHLYDKYYIGSNQELDYISTADANGAKMVQYLPNTSAVETNSANTESGLSVYYSYNATLNSAQSLLYADGNRVITADVLMRESARTPVNIGLTLRLKNDADLTSTMRAQIQAVISAMFDELSIGGQIEQSDIVGRLYSDPTTSGFVEYVRLALDAFYVPENPEDAVTQTNAGDFIKAGVTEYLFLNKLTISQLLPKEGFGLVRVEIPENTITVQSNSNLIGIRYENAQAINSAGSEVAGTLTSYSVNNGPDNNVAQAGNTYSVNFVFAANDAGYDPITTNLPVVCPDESTEKRGG